MGASLEATARKAQLPSKFIDQIIVLYLQYKGAW